MRLRHLLVAAALLPAAPAAVARPVEVTRFFTSQTYTQLGRGEMAVFPDARTDGQSLETRVWLDAVARELALRGFADNGSGVPGRVAEVRMTRNTVERRAESRPRSSIGIGVGSGGGWGRHGGLGASLGLGLGLGFSGSSRRGEVESQLSVVIRDARTRASLWEGRAVSREPAGSKDADLARTAEQLAAALFAGFPGRSGETIEVR